MHVFFLLPNHVHQFNDVLYNVYVTLAYAPQCFFFPGTRASILRTGSVWPPFPGAGQGYWARKAGFYGGVQNREKEKEAEAEEKEAVNNRPKRAALYGGEKGERETEL